MKNFVTQEWVANERKANGYTLSRTHALFLSRPFTGDLTWRAEQFSRA